MKTVLLQSLVMKRLVMIALGTSGVLLAAGEPKQDEPKQRVQVSNTQRIDFPSSGGTLRLKNSTGELTIEAWDQPAVEIATIKSTKEEYAPAERGKASQDLAKVRIAAERKGDELVITTEFPHSELFPPAYPIGGATGFDLDYQIKVPRDAKLMIEHYVGEIHIDGIAGDVNATARQGTIVLHLPEEGQYTIDAKSTLGKVISDFPGTTKRRYWLGHAFAQTSQAPHRLYLRDGFGDIILLKTRTPPEPPPLTR